MVYPEVKPCDGDPVRLSPVLLPSQEQSLARLLPRLRGGTHPDVPGALDRPLLVPACLPHRAMVPHLIEQMFDQVWEATWGMVSRASAAGWISPKGPEPAARSPSWWVLT